MAKEERNRRDSRESVDTPPLSSGGMRDTRDSGRHSVVSVTEDERPGSSMRNAMEEDDGADGVGGSLRKRRHRSHSSSELHSQANYPPEYPFPPVDSPSSYVRDLSATHLAGNGESSGSSIAPSHGPSGSRMSLGDDTTTLRRREANRLAAQRFRSRKKGYQDSLEERIRQLEDERDALLRRLGEHPDGAQRTDDNDPYLRYPSYAPPNRRPFGSITDPSSSPERREMIDVDVRVASLESANRRLQDELRVVQEENEKLQEELSQWRRWGRDPRSGAPSSRLDQDEKPSIPRRRPSLPPLDSSPFTSNYSGTYLPPLASGPSLPSHPPLERARTYHHAPPRGGSPGIRLPPLRLPPLPANISDARTLPSPSMLSFSANDPFRPPRDGAPSPRISQNPPPTLDESRSRPPPE